MIYRALPQIILIVLYVLSLGVELERNDKPKEGRYSFWGNLIATILSLGILYWGGFFNVFFGG